jgi:hypothetical protein
MFFRWSLPVIGAALLLSGAALAADPAPTGTQTRAWVKLQKSGTEASKAAPPRGLPGEAADRVYQRYLQSFTHPIPERFERDRFTGERQQ